MAVKNKTLNILLVLFIVLTTFATKNINIEATTYRPYVERLIGGTEVHISIPDKGIYYYYPALTRIRIDNESRDVAFCIEAEVFGFEGDYHEASDIDPILLKDLELIKYYGFDVTQQSDYDFATTQLMIWERMGVGVNPVGDFSNYYEGMKASVREKIATHHIKPSFAQSKNVARAGDTITLTDANGVLANYTVFDDAGTGAYIEGNTLVIPTSIHMTEISKIELSRINEASIGSALTLRSSHANGQDVSLLKLQDRYMTWVELEVLKLGDIEIAKMDTFGNYVPNVEFKISEYPDMRESISVVTDEFGVAKQLNVTPGLKYVQEAAVQEPYLLDETIHEVMVAVNEIATYTQVNKRAYGEIHLSKEDRENGKNPQGDAVLSGAVYGLYAKSDIVDNISGEKHYLKDELIDQQSVDEGYNIEWRQLQFGNYYVKELIAPTGYQLDTTSYDVNLSYNNSKEAIVIENVVSKEEVIKGKFDIRKVVGEGISGVQKPEIGAKFIVQLESEIMEQGDQAKIYDMLQTDNLGYAQSVDLAFGLYRVTQIESENHNLELSPPFNVDISTHDQDLHYVVSNQQYTAILSIEKYLASTQETIVLSEATFKIWDYQTNDYYFELLGKEIVDTWSTDQSGVATSNLAMKVGKYALCEIDAPQGTLLEEECMDFEIDASFVHEIDEHHRAIQIIRFGNKQAFGVVELNKTHEYLDEIEREVGFELSVGEMDIVNPATGEIIHRKGEVIKNELSDDGLWYTISGKLKIENLNLGDSKAVYYLEEKECFEEYEINHEKIRIEFDANDTNSYVQQVDVVNMLKRTDLLVTKIDADTREVIKGIDGIEFAIYRDKERTEIIEKKAIDPKSGTVTFEKIVYGQTVYLGEIGTNHKYHLSSELIEIVFDKELDGIGKSHEIKFANRKKEAENVKTGLIGNREYFIIAMSVSIVVMSVVRIRRKSDDA